MINKIWFALLLIGIVYGFGKALYRQVNPSPAPAQSSSAPAIEPSIGPGIEPGTEPPTGQVTDPPTGPTDGQVAESHQGAESPAEPGAISANPIRDMGENLTKSSLNAAKTAVELCIVLIGMMTLWLGMLNVAKDAGLVDALARALRPAMRWLFPGVPDGHPAQGAMLMNISANMLGLGNAATPFGLKAMKELQTLNSTPETATNAMATFLAINTSSVTLVAFSIIGGILAIWH